MSIVVKRDEYRLIYTVKYGNNIKKEHEQAVLSYWSQEDISLGFMLLNQREVKLEGAYCMICKFTLL